MHEHQLSLQAAVFPQARVRDERIEYARRRVEKENDLREELGGFAPVSHRVQKRRQHGREEQQRRKGEGRAYHVEGGRVVRLHHGITTHTTLNNHGWPRTKCMCERKISGLIACRVLPSVLSAYLLFRAGYLTVR